MMRSAFSGSSATIASAAVRVRNAYLIVFMVMVGILVGLHIVNQDARQGMQHSMLAIGLSNQQLALSQQIALEARRYAEADDDRMVAATRSRLAELRHRFEANHRTLVDRERIGSDPLTSKTRKVYFGRQYDLDLRSDAFVERIDALLVAPQADRIAQLEKVEQDARGTLRAGLAVAAKRIETDAFDRARQSKTVQDIMLVVMLLVFFGEVLFFFHPLIGFISRSEHLEEAHREAEHEAAHDALTGLPNRRMLDEVMETARENAERLGKPLAVCHLDLDYFKAVNDFYGHAVGDAVLCHAAKLMRETVRETDVVARVGGDEFVIVDPELGDAETVALIAKRIVSLICRPVRIDGHSIQIGASAGVAEFRPDDPSTETLEIQADIALYQAKESGRGQVCIYSGDARQDFERRQRDARTVSRLERRTG